MREPNRPRGVTVDRLPQANPSGSAIDSPPSVYRLKTAKTSATPDANTANVPLNFAGASRLMLVENIPQENKNVSPSKPATQRALDDFVEKPSPADRLLAGFAPADKPQTTQETQPQNTDNSSQLVPQSRRNTVHEFIASDFAESNTQERNPQTASALSRSYSMRVGLDQPVSPNNFDNVVYTVGYIEFAQSRTDVETLKLHATDNFQPTRINPLEAFNKAVKEQGEDDRSQTQFLVAQQNLALNPQVAPVKIEDKQPLQTTAPSSTPQTQTVMTVPVNTLSGMNSNPNGIGTETATTGFRDIEPQQARRPRIVQAIMGTPENLIEKVRVFNEMPLKRDEVSSNRGFPRSDLLNVPVNTVNPLGFTERKQGQDFYSAQPIAVNSTREMQTNPAPAGPEEINVQNIDNAEQIKNSYFDRVTFTYNELVGANDFWNMHSQKSGLNFYYIV